MPTIPTYGVKYQAGWSSIDGSLKGNLIIDKLDYVGEYTPLTLSADAIGIRYAFDDWNSPILGLQLEFSIENNKTDFFELSPLLTAEESEYRARVAVYYPSNYQLFEGFLNVATTTQKYLRFQNIRFTASNYINKLGNFHPPSIDVLQNMNFLTVLQEMFAMTGYYHHFRVNCKLYAEGDIMLPTQTLFTKNGFNTEVFWTNLVDRKSCLDVLKGILTTFDCYIYWKMGYWYVERYEDLWNETKEYVDYAATTAYLTHDSEGTIVEEVTEIRDVHDLLFIEQTQARSIIPGLKTIEINLDDHRLPNLVPSDLANIAGTSDDPPLPANRTWESQTAADISWLTAGKAKNSIANSIQRLLQLPVSTPPTQGLYTRFKTTIGDVDTSINIQFKYIVNPQTISNYTGKLEEHQFLFHWYLKVLPLENFIFSLEDNTWKMAIGSKEHYLQTITVEGSSFDKINNNYEGSITIPLGEIITIVDGLDQGKLIGDVDLLFCFGLETIKVKDTDLEVFPQQAWIGDIVVTSSGDNQDNVITGTLSNKFLNKKDISLVLYDCESYNYLNAILRGENYEIRTERWGVAVNALNIVEKGVCWQVTENPVITIDPKTNDGTGIDPFTSILSGLHHGTTYYVRAYYKDAAGTVVYGANRMFQTLALDIGSYYLGGQIGFFFVEGDEGYIEGEKHGVLVAYGDTSPDIWCRLSDSPRSVSAFSMNIGEGKTNTDLMLDEPTNPGKYAAKKCGDYVVGAYTEWFLPSYLELLRIYKNRNIIGGFAKAVYWSSTEKDDSHNKFAAGADFNASSITMSTTPYGKTDNPWWQKNNVANIRPCRYF